METQPEGQIAMRKYTTALVIAAALAATIAEDKQTSSGPNMGHGMMGDDNNGGGMMGMMKMMKQMSQMMDHCSNMMSGIRPNEQWRSSLRRKDDGGHETQP
jgi:hypothetical protein